MIRPAHPQDRVALVEMYNHYVVRTPITFDVEPFTLESRSSWFEQFRDDGPYRLLVCELDGRVVGYAASMRYRAKPAYARSIETSIYLSPGDGGSGLGAKLYGALFEVLQGEGLHRAYGAITLPNAASVGLHRKFGYVPIGVYREVGYKFGRYWDVEWFEKSLEDEPALES